MDNRTIGLLHPGEMGAAVGQCLAGRGHQVLWVPEGRSPATGARAASAGLTAAGLAELIERSDIIMSVCPPHAALDVARQVAGAGFMGVYMDANAISPVTAREVAGIVETAGASYVDGGIIGTPPVAPGFIRLYLSGPRAGEMRTMFDGSPVDARMVDHEPGSGAGSIGTGSGAGSIGTGSGAGSIGTGSGAGSIGTGSGAGSIGTGSGAGSIGTGSGAGSIGTGSGAGSIGTGSGAGSIGAGSITAGSGAGSVDVVGSASAVKMAYASWTKGTAAMLLAARALARAEGVEETLLAEWGISQPGLDDRSARAAGSAAAKGWRWVAEMEEIAATMAAAGLPGGFHQAAAEIYRRFPPADSAGLEAGLDALVRDKPDRSD